MTSGHYRRFTEIDGVRYSHIVDPRTGKPVSALASVTVLAPTATLADAIATAVSVMGREAGVSLMKRLDGVDYVLIEGEPDDFRTYTSEGLKREGSMFSVIAPQDAGGQP